MSGRVNQELLPLVAVLWCSVSESSSEVERAMALNLLVIRTDHLERPALGLEAFF